MSSPSSADQLRDRIEVALGAMGRSGPRPLLAYLKKPGPDFEEASSDLLAEAIDQMLSANPNDAARLLFAGLLRSWDNTREAPWTKGTPRNKQQRRELIHSLLESTPELIRRIDLALPFFQLDEPVVIAREHRDWYTPGAPGRSYYWETYLRYLEAVNRWEPPALLNLDNSTRAVLESLANPESEDAYSSRGLVMGHVQSGKTANFTGVIARAGDAGYRLIILLAGTWNILRNQTQRRLDKELLGKELLVNDPAYQAPHPEDWTEFLDHGFNPSERGHYRWQRLTRPEIDFKSLKAAIESLNYERRDKTKPLYHPENLHSLPAKLLVVKKHSGILANLLKDMRLLSEDTRFQDLPTLIIDDESDQAGLNTLDPTKRTADKERSKTNAAIVQLLRVLPRAQYVGYTATPYANALVDPEDPEDLFPKDFIVSLEPPAGYMGISDIFDPTVDYADLDPKDFREREIAHIRRVERADGADDEDLILAMRSYVLAGAVKLFRAAADPARYRFPHHTMLVHTSSRTAHQATSADRIRELWDKCRFNGPAGRDALENLWRSDVAPVSAAHGPGELSPERFDDLVKYLDVALRRIDSGPHPYLVVNKDSPAAPDFSAGPVWKIFIGGNKLSRGYTVEGLTVSYYRRVTNTADTLMQMGRWFGFRRGYQDLVRIFLGVREGRHGTTDLVSLFKQVCLMEQRFRQEITRYVRSPGTRRITPYEVPPLISVVGELPPTSKNKMFNSEVKSRNYGGLWSQPTLSPQNEDGIGKNQEALRELLLSARDRTLRELGGASNQAEEIRADSLTFLVDNAGLAGFLGAYQWLENEFPAGSRPRDIQLQIEFLGRADNGVSEWLIIAPQRRDSFGTTFTLDRNPNGEMAVKRRARVAGGRFGVFGEPSHRAIAEFLVPVREPSSRVLVKPNPVTASLVKKKRGAVLLYPVREHRDGAVTVGFELVYPKNELSTDVAFTVRKKQDRAVIEISEAS